jgi:uncharacterized iron-regulated membrane protein
VDPFLGSGLFILGAVVWVVCAVYAYRMAPSFGRGAVAWGILGIILGPIALMALYLLPKREPKAGHGHHEDPRAELYERPKKH